jgi:hypothetical protein
MLEVMPQRVRMWQVFEIGIRRGGQVAGFRRRRLSRSRLPTAIDEKHSLELEVCVACEVAVEARLMEISLYGSYNKSLVPKVELSSDCKLSKDL